MADALHDVVAEWAAEIAAFAISANVVALGLFDRTGAILYANDALRALLGARGEVEPSLRHLLEPRLPALAAGDGELAYQGPLTFGGAGGTPRTVPGEIRRRDGYLLLLAEAGSERHAELQQALEESQAALRALEKEMSRFIGVAAHDLRSPLANILTASAYLRDTLTGVGGDHETLLEFIPQQAQYMLSLINDLLDVSQFESGTFMLDREWIEVQPFVEATVRQHRRVAEMKNIRLEMHLASGGCADADPKRLRQVLDNLISNAIKFSPRGSTITVAAERAAGELRFSVRDEGPGISEQDQQQLFQYFSRASARPTGDETSTGLGLAIARRVVEAHGGKIGVISAPGEGSTFWFTLPCEA